MSPLASTPVETGTCVADEASGTGPDHPAPARLRSSTMRPPPAASHQPAAASPDAPSAIRAVVSPELTVIPTLTPGSESCSVGCQAAAPALATAVREQSAASRAMTAVLAGERLTAGRRYRP